MGEPDFDCIVVGDGPGGYMSAIRTRQLGMKAPLSSWGGGGICLNWGCIPTKVLLRTSEAFLWKAPRLEN